MNKLNVEEIKSNIKERSLTPKEAARYLSEILGLEGGKKIFLTDVAKKLDIDIWEVKDIPSKNKNHEIWGYLKYITKNKSEIFISKKIPYNSKRFTIAHEIAHFIIDNDNAGDVAFRTRFLHDPKESKYNIFAINLLIPSFEDYKKVKKENNNSLEATANHFGVPITPLIIYEETEEKNLLKNNHAK